MRAIRLWAVSIGVSAAFAAIISWLCEQANVRASSVFVALVVASLVLAVALYANRSRE